MTTRSLPRLLLAVVSLVLLAPVALAQMVAPPPPPPPPPPMPSDQPPAPTASLTAASGKPVAFAVYSAKPHGEGQYGRFICIGDSCDIQNLPMRAVILNAFNIQDDKLLIGGPAWLTSEPFDIMAKIDPADMPTDGSKFTVQQLIQLLQPVLVEVFHLKMHHETRTFPAYEMLVAKSGLKMKQAVWPPTLPPAPPGAPAMRPPPKPNCLVLQKGNGFRSGHYCTTEDMVRIFENPAGRFLVDKTGLTGPYDFEFCYSNERTPEGDPNFECPTVFTALQEQLGIHLESTTASFDVTIIDSAEKPSVN